MGVKVKLWKGQRGVYGIFIDHLGRRKAKKVGDKKAAEAVASGIRRALAEGTFKLAPRSIGFTALAEEWLEKYPTRQISPNTLENYASVVRAHLKSLPVTEIGFTEIEDFIAAKRRPGGSARSPERPLAESSISLALVALRLILDRAVRVHRLLAANPVQRVAKRRSTQDGGADPFSPEELRAILTAATALNRPFATFLRLWAQTGMRKGEVSALQNQDLDLVKGTAHVRRTWTRERLGPPKTRRSRVVSMLHPLTEDTAEWRPGRTAESRRILVELRALPVQSINPEAFVFGIDKPWSPTHVQLHWRRVLQKAGVRYRFPEQLRHTFASSLLSRGANLLYVQKQGGWKNASVLLQVYAQYVEQGEEASQARPDATQAQPRQVGGTGERGLTPIGQVSVPLGHFKR
jgi:integrase